MILSVQFYFNLPGNGIDLSSTHFVFFIDDDNKTTCDNNKKNNMNNKFKLPTVHSSSNPNLLYECQNPKHNEQFT